MQGGLRNEQDSKSALAAVRDVGVRIPPGTPLEVVDAGALQEARGRGDVLLTPPNISEGAAPSPVLMAAADTTLALGDAAHRVREGASSAAGAAAAIARAADRAGATAEPSATERGLDAPPPATTRQTARGGAAGDFAGGQTGTDGSGLVDREFTAAFGRQHTLLPPQSDQPPHL